MRKSDWGSLVRTTLAFLLKQGFGPIHFSLFVARR